MQLWSFRGIMYISSNLLTLERIQQNINTATTNLEKVVCTCETWIWKTGSTELGVHTSEHQDNFQYWLQEIFASIIPSSIKLGPAEPVLLVTQGRDAWLAMNLISSSFKSKKISF